MKKMRKLLSLLALSGAMIMLPVGSVNAMAASNDMAVATRENVTESKELTMKQLISKMEAGEVKAILWHENTEKKHADNEAYIIWVNSADDENEYMVSEDGYRVIKDEAIKNDIKFAFLPLDGDIIYGDEFKNVYNYESIRKVELGIYLIFPYLDITTNQGNIVVKFNNLDEMRACIHTYRLDVGDPVNSKSVAFTAFVILILCFLAFAMIYMFIYPCLESSKKNEEK